MDRDRLRFAFEFQAKVCRGMGSELYARLLEHCLDAIDREADRSFVYALLRDWEGDPVYGFLPLRLLAGVHRRVLEGREPELAAHYPTMGGVPRFPDAARAFAASVVRAGDALRPALGHVPQTNEVNRCAGLLGGFLTLAQETRRPLRLLELGASAGLNLRWDHFRYELGPHRWGDPTATAVVRTAWRGPWNADWTGTRTAVGPVEVEARLGCDAAPIDPLDEEQIGRLGSFIWADQPERLERQRRAVDVARRVPARLEHAHAPDWLDRRLREPADGVARVVFHSSVWVYLDSSARDRIRDALAAAGRAATPDSPLAWLRLEDGDPRDDLILTTWPGGRERVLAVSDPHCRRVFWDMPPPVAVEAGGTDGAA